MRFHRLDLNLLIILNHMLSGKSVTQVASFLGLTQPAISSSLAKLREHFEDELFVQVGRNLEPTPFAQSISNDVQAAVENIERLITKKSYFDPNEAERTFFFICSDYVFDIFIAPLAARLANDAPKVKIVALLVTDLTSQLLGEGKVDFRITPKVRIEDSHPFMELFDDNFTCIKWAENNEIGDEITMEQYLSSQHISVTLGPQNPLHIEQESMAMLGIKRKISVYAPTFNSVASAVIGTGKIATIHTRSALYYEKYLPIKLLKMPFKIETFTECLQWHRNRENDSGIIWLRNYIQDFLRNHFDQNHLNMDDV